MEQQLDILLLGATGYTGKFTAKCLALVTKGSEFSDLRWGIAGRSKEKMQDLLSELEALDIDVTRIAAIEFDVIEKKDTLTDITGRAKVVMNATGPCITLSEPIVKACIESNTHYVDISAELFHMINIYKDLNTAAIKANVLIVPSCGFACIPVIAGLNKLEKTFKGTLHSVECYTTLDIPLRANFCFPGHNNSLIHYGTWQSLVFELKNYKRYSELKKKTFSEVPQVPDELKKSFFHRNKGRFWYPYPGPENDVIEQTQLYRSKQGKTPYYFKIYTTMPLFIHFVILVPIFFIYYLLSSFACFRKLLWRFPGFFTYGLASHKGPSESMRNDTKFCFELNGRGWSNGVNTNSLLDESLTVKVSGNDPGYRTTAICFVFAAIAVLRERSKMPTGGVLPAGVAFSQTAITENLMKHGLCIEECT